MSQAELIGLGDDPGYQIALEVVPDGVGDELIGVNPWGFDDLEELDLEETPADGVDPEDSFEDPSGYTPTSAIQLLKRDIGRHPRITPEEELELAKKIESGDEAAREKMINSNLRLVFALAKNYQNRGLDFLDLFQLGTLGLSLAVDNFDHRKGNIGDHAGRRIRQSIRRGLDEQARTIHVPLDVVKNQRALRKLETDFLARGIRNPSDEEILAQTGLTPGGLQNARLAMRQKTTSLDAVWVGDGDGFYRLIDVLPDPATNGGLSGGAETSDDTDFLTEGLDSLSPTARRILELSFGLDPLEPEPLSQAEIGRILGLKSDNVSFKKRMALKELARYEELKRAENSGEQPVTGAPEASEASRAVEETAGAGEAAVPPPANTEPRERGPKPSKLQTALGGVGLESIMPLLSDQEQAVIGARFQPDGSRALGQPAVSRLLGLSPTELRRIEIEALDQITYLTAREGGLGEP